jgi:hypothetical protein
MCRRLISLFNLRDVHDHDSFAIERNTDVRSWPIVEQTYLQRPIGRHVSKLDELMEELADKEGPIKGFGMEFHFHLDVPAVRFTTTLHSYDPNVLDKDQGHLTELKFDEFHFHQDTMTFHGKCTSVQPWTLEKPIKDAHTDSICCPTIFYDELECILQFAPDGRYIRDGFLSWSYFDTSSLCKQYPLDGTWECKLNSGRVLKIHVQFHSFDLMSKRCHFFINNDNKVQFKIPGLLLRESKQEILPDTTGPCIGETLSWESNNTAFGCEWKRLSMNLDEISRVVRMNPLVSDSIGPGVQFIYSRVGNEDTRDLDTLGPTYHADSLWGNTFCQAFTVGLASYHFIKPEEDRVNNNTEEFQAYISYENPKTTQWPNLDNGHPIPSRVQFRNIQWNEETRTFKGDILWMEDYGTTWTGDSKWMYEITFDTSYRFIQSGTCTMSNREPTHQFFGHDLIYLNAALESVFSKALESASSTEEYLDILRECRDDGASSSTLQCLGEVAMYVMSGGGESCFDYNL